MLFYLLLPYFSYLHLLVYSLTTLSKGGRKLPYSFTLLLPYSLTPLLPYSLTPLLPFPYSLTISPFLPLPFLPYSLSPLLSYSLTIL